MIRWFIRTVVHGIFHVILSSQPPFAHSLVRLTTSTVLKSFPIDLLLLLLPIVGSIFETSAPAWAGHRLYCTLYKTWCMCICVYMIIYACDCVWCLYVHVLFSYGLHEFWSLLGCAGCLYRVKFSMSLQALWSCCGGQASKCSSLMPFGVMVGDGRSWSVMVAWL